MRHTCLLAVAVLIVSVCGWAQTSTSTKRDGNRLLQDCGALVRHADAGFTAAANTYGSDWCLGYLTGFAEGFDAMAMAVSRTYEEYSTLRATHICFPDGSTVGQDARVLVKFLNDHPERLHEDEEVLVYAAFTTAYPCAPKPDPKTKTKTKTK